MSVSLWLAFCLAYLLMAVTPGPVTLLVTSYALSQGRRTALAVVAGTILGDTTCLVAALLGLGAVLAASATAFAALKILGALYLVFLGVRMWRSPVSAREAEGGGPSTGHARMFLHAYATTTLNPKSVLFLMVFVPQFMDPSAPIWPQLAVLVPSVLVLGTLVDGSYAMAASTLRRFTRAPGAQRLVNRVCGGLLVGEGVGAVAWRGLLA